MVILWKYVKTIIINSKKKLFLNLRVIQMNSMCLISTE